jgi:2-polyprenyl-3-methyl-5-hydroxy-6-metoxy-1,4-benzoquinol methylase
MNDWRTRIYKSYRSTTSQNPYNVGAQRTPDALAHQHLQRYLRFLPQDRNSPILDIGCGTGEVLYALKVAGFRCLTGVDASPEQTDAARQQGIAEIYESDALSFLLARSSSYRIITAFNVLEHLDREQLFALMDAVVRSLEQGGRFLAVVPNAKGLFGANVRYADITHEQSFTPTSVCQICAVVGLKPVAIVEQGPIIHGPISLMRWGIWQLFRSLLLLARVAEGADWHWRVYTQDMLWVAEKPR